MGFCWIRWRLNRLVDMDIKLTGIEDMIDTLEMLPKELMKSAETAVLMAGGKLIEASAKSKVREKTGALKESIATNVKSIKGHKTARVGPRAGFHGKSLGFKTNKKGQTTERFVTPNKYSHFVEFGTSRTAAKPFIRPAIDETSGAVLGAMSAGLSTHLTKVVDKLRKKKAKPIPGGRQS